MAVWPRRSRAAGALPGPLSTFPGRGAASWFRRRRRPASPATPSPAPSTPVAAVLPACARSTRKKRRPATCMRSTRPMATSLPDPACQVKWRRIPVFSVFPRENRISDKRRQRPSPARKRPVLFFFSGWAAHNYPSHIHIFQSAPSGVSSRSESRTSPNLPNPVTEGKPATS